MAQAGFIFSKDVESNDRAECKYCNLGLDGWESDDNPTYSLIKS